MNSSEIRAILQNLKNIQISLNEASGKAVSLEIKMRLIAELSPLIQDKIQELVIKSKRKGKSYQYWDCDLAFLDKAIDEVFNPQLKPNEQQQIEKFRDLRNALLHGNLVVALCH